jgi:16S rRNA (adenine1518-N6/adenine1519-N6)-dimethyltransferase
MAASRNDSHQHHPMTPKEIIEFMRKNEVRPVHERGQHFLMDETAVEALADAAGIVPGQPVVEVGPGPGVLTAELLARGANVVAVEIDARFAEHLEKIFINKPFNLLRGDVLDMPNRDLAAAVGANDDGSYVVASNLPYCITSAALSKFLLNHPLPKSITVMIQREVADRLLAKSGEMSQLAVLVQTLGQPKKIRNVPRGAFKPAPKVDSAIVHIDVRQPLERAAFFGDIDSLRYSDLVRAGFSAPRKKLRNTLAAIFGSSEAAEQALNQAKISPNSRPEELTPEEWLRLAKVS